MVLKEEISGISAQIKKIHQLQNLPGNPDNPVFEGPNGPLPLYIPCQTTPRFRKRSFGTALFIINSALNCN
jgi:hypothetical protein